MEKRGHAGFFKKVSFYEAIATLTGTTIGAGVLGIPYVVAKAGFWTGMLVIFLMGISILLINLFLGEVVLRTKGFHQLTGYAEIYLGKWGKRLLMVSVFIGINGALVAYLIGVGEALALIFNTNAFIMSLIFFIIAAFLIFKGLRAIADSELFLSGIVILLTLIISGIALGSENFDVARLEGFDMGMFFVPYGVILFAFIGAAAIPEMGEELIKERKKLKKAIIIGTLIPLVLYVLFAIAVIGVTGISTTEIASMGLGKLLGKKMLVLVNLFPIFSMATSFLTLGLALKQVYNYDYKINKNISWALTCFIPLIVFLLGVKSFIRTIGFVGTVAGGIDGILIILMLWNAKSKGKIKAEYSMKHYKIIGILLMLIFILGIFALL